MVERPYTATWAIDRVSRGTARARIERNIYTALASAAAMLWVLSYPGAAGAASQMPQLHQPYAYALLGVSGVLPIVVGILSWIAPRRVTRAVAGTTAVAFILAMAAFPWGLIETHLANDHPPFFQGIHAIHAMIAAVVWQHRAIWSVGLAHGVIIGVVQFLVRQDSARTATVDALGSTVFALILMGVAVALIMAADRQDQAMAQARDLAVRGVATRTREREESRIDAMVHDDIMSVLITASRENPPAGLQEQAQNALRAVTTMHDSDATQRRYTPSELLHTLTRHAEAIAPDITVIPQLSGSLKIPAEVVAALTEALEEAVRNSVRHAGGPQDKVIRTVTVTVHDNGVRVQIADTGRGFTPPSVEERRLGLRLSIVERMALVEGGKAAVQSKPGHGAVMTLTWRES